MVHTYAPVPHVLGYLIVAVLGWFARDIIREVASAVFSERWEARQARKEWYDAVITESEEVKAVMGHGDYSMNIGTFQNDVAELKERLDELERDARTLDVDPTVVERLNDTRDAVDTLSDQSALDSMAARLEAARAVDELQAAVDEHR